MGEASTKRGGSNFLAREREREKGEALSAKGG